MKYVTGIERRGIERGRQEGQAAALQTAVVEVLEARFGEVRYSLRETVSAENDLTVLKRWHRLAIQTPSLDAFQQQPRKP